MNVTANNQRTHQRRFGSIGVPPDRERLTRDIASVLLGLLTANVVFADRQFYNGSRRLQFTSEHW